MSDTIIYRLDGRYFGFIRDGNLFRGNGEYFGWAEESGHVWQATGRFLGEIVEENYILRRIGMTAPGSKYPRIAPIPPVPPVPQVNRVYKIGLVGWIDSLRDEDGRGTLNSKRAIQDREAKTQEPKIRNEE